MSTTMKIKAVSFWVIPATTMKLLIVTTLVASAAHAETVVQEGKTHRLGSPRTETSTANGVEGFADQSDGWDENELAGSEFEDRSNPMAGGGDPAEKIPLVNAPESESLPPVPPAGRMLCDQPACQVVALTNAERVKQGLSELRLDPVCQKAAQDQAEDMAQKQYFTYTSPIDGSSVLSRYQSYLPSRPSQIEVHENIAMGSKLDAKRAVDAWMNTPSDREKVLAKTSKATGVGVAERGTARYFVQCFSN